MTSVLLLLLGCAYKVHIESDPIGANVTLPGGRNVQTPADVKLRWVPFGHQRIEVRAGGYRPLELDLRRHEIRLSRYVSDAFFRPRTWLGAPRGDIELVLIPRHGPSGTWTPEDVGERGTGLRPSRDR